MALYDLVITGGTIVTGNGLITADLAIRSGRIVAFLNPGDRVDSHDQLDACGKWIMPGVIDTHCHFRDPGKMEREDFTTGTFAAAAGGVTTVLEMPISVPPVNSGEVLKNRAETVQRRSVIDFALYGAGGKDNIDRVGSLVQAGAVGIKTFLHAPHPGREHEFEGLWTTDEGVLRDLMQAVAATGLRHCFHCENDAMINHIEGKLKATGRKDGMAHCEGRPESVEAVSVATVLALAEEVGAKVQIVHLSSPISAALAADAKRRGVDVTVETCPHYLSLTEEALAKFGPYAKCNPPLRSARSVAKLWEYVRNGTVDMIGSDHAPFVPAEKQCSVEDIWLAPAGFPSLEVMLPVMLTAAADGQIDITDVVRLTSEKAAQVFGLPRKGKIAIGADADLVVVDPQAEWTFDKTAALSKAREIMHVFDGVRFKGKVLATLVRGTRVFEGGEIKVNPGYGAFIRPERAGR